MELLNSDDERLRTACRLVSPEDDLSELIKELTRICLGTRAVGLAANQIGSDLRVFVLNISGIKVYINPEIISSEDEYMFIGEGCLSFPGEILCTNRFNKISIVSDNCPQQIMTGIEAVAFQHELDHLNGITMHQRRIK